MTFLYKTLPKPFSQKSRSSSSSLSFLVMASRCQSISKPAFSLMRSSLVKGMRRPSNPISPTTLLPRPSHSFSRLRSEMGSLQTLLPLYSAVSSARLTSCLGVDSRSSRSLSQGTLENPGV